jgi:hypothetical protein
MTPRYRPPDYDYRPEDEDAVASPSFDPSQPHSLSGPHQVAARGFSHMFELHPILALTAITTDCMVSAVDVASLGTTAPFLWAVAGVFVGITVFLGQKKWSSEDAQSALIKALIVGFLTALPTPLPSFLTVPSGVLGLVQTLRRRK